MLSLSLILYFLIKERKIPTILPFNHRFVIFENQWQPDVFPLLFSSMGHPIKI